MTPKEAIKCIDDVMDSTYNYDETIDYQLTSDDFDWLEKAKEALEKQIPKKPITTKDGNKSCSCGLVVQTGYIRNCLYYCDNCGQAIDWRDVE